MAVLYITEWPPITAGRPIAQVPAPVPISEQTIPIGAASSVSTVAFQKGSLVELSADTVCSIKWTADGTTPTATAVNFRLAANTYHTFGPVGPGFKVAAIINT